MCENITVRGVTMNTVGAPNGDGCDPESSKNVLIEDLKNVLNINLLNCTWTNVKENNRLEGLIEGLAFRNTTINGKMVK